MITALDEAAEAANGALHALDFVYLGNSDEGRIDWWTRRGAEPHKVARVSVERQPLGFLVVSAEWPTLAADGQLMRAKQTWTVPVASQTRDSLIDSVAVVVERVLLCYRAILLGTAPTPSALGD